MARAPALALSLLVALSACSSESQLYTVTGVVQQVDADGRWVKVAHDDIEDFMPAMTMDFGVSRPELLAGVQSGTAIRFALERTSTTLTIVGLEIVGQGEAALGASAPLPHEVQVAAPFTLTDQDGKAFDSASLRGSVVLMEFIFTRCPGPCPMITAAHVRVQKTLPESIASRVRFVSITLDPEYDTPERLRVYADERGVDLASWSLLTGEPEQVDAVLSAYHIGKRPSEEGILDHFIASFVVDPEGRIAETFIGTNNETDAVIKAIERALG